MGSSRMEVFGKGSCKGESMRLRPIVMIGISSLCFNDGSGLVAFFFPPRGFSLITTAILPGRNYNYLYFIGKDMRFGQIALLFEGYRQSQ